MKLKVFAALLAILLTTVGCADGGDQGISTGDVPKTDISDSQAPTEETTAAETKPSKPLWQEEGLLSSKESETTQLLAKWSAVSYDGETAEVKVELVLSCYSISTGAHPGSVTVNGVTQTFTTPAMQNTRPEKKKFSLATLDFEVDLMAEGLSLLDIEALWEFDDTDGNVQIDRFRAAAIIKVPGGEVYVPETQDGTHEPSPAEESVIDLPSTAFVTEEE